MTATAVRKSFGSKVILDGVSISVPPRSTHVIIGPSGGGKSTLLRSLAGLETIDAGEIRVGSDVLQSATDGERAPRMTSAQIRLQRRVGMVSQGFDLFPHKRAIENVELPLRLVLHRSKDEARAIAERELAAFGLADHQDKLPGQLSGGQKQRVAIARALAMRPGVLLFDEPTSALDPELVGGVIAIMKELAREGMTMIVVTHEMQFAAEAADTVTFVSEGRVAESGPTLQVLRSPAQEATKRFLSRLNG
ncbi:MAG TPA: amino acid ABC transporter ATP-binding protein [Lacisediminihabitans sp.]|uniref:amino acid ABC transporter ATP-binding protein n=1 Tax=Lacisediminihabitans sp. TaxID=2787631 RepID=UPI002EDA49E2